MKRILFLLSMAGMLMLSACEPESNDPNDPGQPNQPEQPEQPDQPVQEDPQLSVSPESITIAPAGGSQVITLSANRDWTVSVSDSWLSVSPSSGTASENPLSVTVNGSANTTYGDRSATVTIQMADQTKTVSVLQAANLALILTNKAYDLTSDAQSIDIEVQANVEYTVSISDAWVKETGTKALTSKTLTFSVEENTSYDGRSATITIRPQDSSVAEQVVTIRQAQKDALIVEDTSFELPYGGGAVEIKVETNVDFDVIPGVDWIHYSATKALSSPTVYLVIDENETTSAREGTVVIKQKGGPIQHTVTIKQAGQIAVTSITLNKEELVLKEGESETLIVTISPENASNKTITWFTGNEEVATVDQYGCVTGVKAGAALITAQATGGQQAFCYVTVTGQEEERIKTALMKIHDAMDGPNWTITHKWDLSTPLKDWEGVKWYPENGELELYFDGQFGLKGELPDCFDGLTALTDIHIQNEPGVSGILPPSFSKLRNLHNLAIYGSSMTSLPDMFEGIPLYFALVSGNTLMSGPLPESLGSSPDLTQLIVGGNAFTGTVPDSWARLGTGLDLAEASLDARVPDSFINSEDADYLVNMYLTAAYWRKTPLVVGDYDIPAFWPRKDLTDLVTGQVIPYKEIISRNKVTILLNWATWCPFSKTLMPLLKNMYDKYHGDGLEIIAAYNADGPDLDMGRPLKDILLERNYEGWYNFNIWQLNGTEWNMWCAGTPSATLVDNKGNIMATSRTGVNDPTRRRFGYVASTNLIPLLEGLFGPLQEEDDYFSTDFSKDGEVMTIQTATVGKGINIVFMGDAYTDRDMGAGGLYEQMMWTCAEAFFSIEPYKTFRNRFNVYAVKVVSRDGKTGNGCSTALGSVATYDSISTGDTEKCFEYARKVPGIKDDKNLLISVLVNSVSERGITVMSESRQSGVAYSGSRLNEPEAFGPTVRHEAGGHGFAFLDDEYVTHNDEPTQAHIDFRTAMYQQYGWYANVDFTNDPAKIKWSYFLSDERYTDEVGIFEGGSLYQKGAYRPSDNSMMNANFEYFNAPSRWAIYKRIMELSGEEPSFDKFLEYDAVNRGKGQNAAPRPPLKAAEKRPATYLAPPVVVP